MKLFSAKLLPEQKREAVIVGLSMLVALVIYYCLFAYIIPFLGGF